MQAAAPPPQRDPVRVTIADPPAPPRQPEKKQASVRAAAPTETEWGNTAPAPPARAQQKAVWGAVDDGDGEDGQFFSPDEQASTCRFAHEYLHDTSLGFF